MDVFKISVPNGIEVGTFDNTNLNKSYVIFTYAVHRGHIVLALQLQHEILFKPITINILHNIYLFYLTI